MSKEAEELDLLHAAEEMQQMLETIRELQRIHGKEASTVIPPEIQNILDRKQNPNIGYQNLEEMAVFLEQQIDLSLTMHKIGLYSKKNAALQGEKMTRKRLIEYINDTHWILPYVKKAYGIDSPEYKSLEPFAMMKDKFGEEE